jgi:t-SNARE complex subunit (syntaxin)
MGWKGAVRSVGAAVRAAERDAKRRQRELERQEKHYAKMQELEQAAYDVDVYENNIELLQSLHKDCSEQVNWGGIAKTTAPVKPNKSDSKKIKQN